MPDLEKLFALADMVLGVRMVEAGGTPVESMYVAIVEGTSMKASQWSMNASSRKQELVKVRRHHGVSNREGSFVVIDCCVWRRTE
jgi:hypothetical protein